MDNLGQVVDQIRRNRGIKINELCQGIISPSTYSRFVKGQSYISSESFVKIINRLHMTFAMFLQDYQTFFTLKHDYAILNHAKAYNQLDIIEDLINKYEEAKELKGWRTADDRFLKVARTILNLMIEAPKSLEHLMEVQFYFSQLKAFSDNDYFALKLLLPYMTAEDAEKVMAKQLSKISDLKEPALAENIYYVCGILYTKHLQGGNRKAAEKYFVMLEDIFLDHMDLGWKMAHQMYQAIHLYFNEDKAQAIEMLIDLRAFYNDLSLYHQATNLNMLALDLGIALEGGSLLGNNKL